MDSNPTICDENWQQVIQIERGAYRETKSVDTIAFRFCWTIIRTIGGGLLVMLSVDGCIKSVKIYKNLEKLYNKKSWLFIPRKIIRLINESAFVSLKYVTWH